MNLQHKMANKTTATVQILDECSCIFSDEVSDNNSDCLFIVEGDNFEDLKERIRVLAREKAAGTRFVPKINFIKDGKCLIFVIEPEKF